MKPYSRLLLITAFLIFSAGCTDHLQEGTAAYKAKNYAVALKELQPLADKGNAGAQLVIGAMYDNGEGLPLDYRQAVMWYTKAAEQGNGIGDMLDVLVEIIAGKWQRAKGKAESARLAAALVPPNLV